MASSHSRPGWILALLLASSCREGTESGGDFNPVLSSTAGTQGCGPSTPVPGTITPVLTSALIGPKSQIAAVAGTETLYLTAADGSIHELVFPGPTDNVLVAPGVIESAVLMPLNITGSAELSGITVFDDERLIVAEHASNTLLVVRRDLPDDVDLLAGLPNALGGFSDGPPGPIRFHFTASVPLLASAFGTVYVGDTENHALRVVAVGGISTSATIAGNGAPGDDDGNLTVTRLDTPSGLATTCAGEVLLMESGRAGLGGHRLLNLAIGDFEPLFGGFAGSAMTQAGDGTNATTQGIDGAAQLGTPEGLVSTEDGILFWVDALDGVLRRFEFGTGLSDCPPFTDCAAAVAAGGSFSGDHFSLALGASGSVYVLEGFAAGPGTLYRVDP